MRKIDLNTHGIALVIHEGRGAIVSDLHEETESDSRRAAIDTLEAIILGHALSNVNVESDSYIKGVEIAVKAILSDFVDKPKRTRRRRKKKR